VSFSIHVKPRAQARDLLSWTPFMQHCIPAAVCFGIPGSCKPLGQVKSGVPCIAFDICQQRRTKRSIFPTQPLKLTQCLTRRSRKKGRQCFQRSLLPPPGFCSSIPTTASLQSEDGKKGTQSSPHSQKKNSSRAPQTFKVPDFDEPTQQPF